MPPRKDGICGRLAQDLPSTRPQGGSFRKQEGLSVPTPRLDSDPSNLFPEKCNLQGYLAHGKLLPLGPYSRPMSRALRWSKGRRRFLMSEAPQYTPIMNLEIKETHRGRVLLYRGTSLIRKCPLS